MRIGTLRTAGWCTLGTLASPSCGREIQFYKVNSWIFTFRAPGDSRPSFEPILHKSRRKDLQVGQEDRETRLNGLVVVREAGEQEAGKPRPGSQFSRWRPGKVDEPQNIFHM